MPEQSLEPNVLWKGQDGYEEARQGAVWHRRKPRRFPEGIVRVRSEQDVLDAVRLARSRGLRVKARSGGHSWTASSVRDGTLLIDLSGLDELTTDLDSGTASVQPGARGRELNAKLAGAGLFFPTGHCPSIAVGGFLLQGGWGWHSRHLGPACLSVTGVDVATADGELVHADENSNFDLLWAARGAGAGYFGVVTRYYLRCHPLPPAIMTSGYVYPVEYVGEILRWAHALHDQLPSQLELGILIMNQRTREQIPLPGEPAVHIGCTALCDSTEEARAGLKLLEGCPARQAAIVADAFVPRSFDALYDFGGSAETSEYAWSSDGLWSNADAGALVPVVEEMVAELPTPPSHVFWWPWTDPRPLDGCALSITARHYVAAFSGWREPEEEALYAGWPADLMRRADHLSVGIQLADENLLGRAESRFMTDENLSRLEGLRAQHDPDGVFASYLYGSGDPVQ